MRRFAILTLILVLALAGAAVAKDKVFGKGVTDGENTKISTILAKPGEFAGRTLRVEGVAVGVCEHRGCWLELASDKQGETMRIKVEDGVIVFPREIIGEHVRVEGVFNVNTPEQQKACDRAKESSHDPFDEVGEGQVEKQDQCVTHYQIDATGATVDWK